MRLFMQSQINTNVLVTSRFYFIREYLVFWKNEIFILRIFISLELRTVNKPSLSAAVTNLEIMRCDPISCGW